MLLYQGCHTFVMTWYHLVRLFLLSIFPSPFPSPSSFLLFHSIPSLTLTYNTLPYHRPLHTSSGSVFACRARSSPTRGIRIPTNIGWLYLSLTFIIMSHIMIYVGKHTIDRFLTCCFEISWTLPERLDVFSLTTARMQQNLFSRMSEWRPVCNGHTESSWNIGWKTWYLSIYRLLDQITMEFQRLGYSAFSGSNNPVAIWLNQPDVTGIGLSIWELSSSWNLIAWSIGQVYF